MRSIMGETPAFLSFLKNREKKFDKKRKFCYNIYRKLAKRNKKTNKALAASVVKL